MRGATENQRRVRNDGQISTHAPLAGRDNIDESAKNICGDFNPRAPCGARLHSVTPLFGDFNFNPRAPCGARRQRQRASAKKSVISTHAPLAGRDLAALVGEIKGKKFQPTRPLRGATFIFLGQFYAGLNFNPRAPCGARLMSAISSCLNLQFQPTRPLRGATQTVSFRRSGYKYFNPRAPCGARPNPTTPRGRLPPFQPTRPLRGATNVVNVDALDNKISTHAPLAGRDII